MTKIRSNLAPPLRYTFVDILRAILLSLESMIEDPELQVNGFILIIDWSNFTFKQASKLTPSMLRLAIEGLQVRHWGAEAVRSYGEVGLPGRLLVVLLAVWLNFASQAGVATASFCFY